MFGVMCVRASTFTLGERAGIDPEVAVALDQDQWEGRSLIDGVYECKYFAQKYFQPAGFGTIFSAGWRDSENNFWAKFSR